MAASGSNPSQKALAELLAVADNTGCQCWLEQHVGNSGPDVAQFTSDDLKELPTLTQAKIDSLFLKIRCPSNKTKSTKNWAPMMIQSDSQVRFADLSLFLFSACIGGKLAPCQPPVNGARFTDLIQKVPKDVQAFNSTVVAYKIRLAGASSNAGVLLPRTYEHSLKFESNRSISKYGCLPSCVTKEDMLELFAILFGSCPNNGKDWVGLEQDGGPCKLLKLLLLYMDFAYHKQPHLRCKQLLTAIGRYVFGAESCIRKLNELSISNQELSAATLAVFSCVVPVKLGFLSGDSFAVGAHQTFASGCKSSYAGYTLRSTTTILQPRTPDSSKDLGINDPSRLPTKDLKCHSNDLNEAVRAGCITGSIKDFCLDMLLKFKSQGNSLVETNEYLADLGAREKDVLQAIVEEGKHNPHLGLAIDSYKVKCLLEVEGRGPGPITEQEFSNFTLDHADILKKFKATRGNPNAFAKECKMPRNLFILMTILTDFHDKSNAEALSDFANDKVGVTFFPTGSVSRANLKLGEYARSWHKLQAFRKSVTSQIFQMYCAQHDIGRVENIKTQKHRHVRKITPEILELVRKYGMMCVPPAAKDYKKFCINIKGSSYASSLQGITIELLKAIAVWSEVSSTATDEVPAVSYGKSLVEAMGFTTQIEQIDLTCAFKYGGENISPFQLVHQLLSGEAEDSKPLLHMIETALEKKASDKRAIKEEKEAAKRAKEEVATVVSNSSTKESELRHRERRKKKSSSPFIDDEAGEDGENRRQGRDPIRTDGYDTNTSDDEEDGSKMAYDDPTASVSPESKSDDESKIDDDIFEIGDAASRQKFEPSDVTGDQQLEEFVEEFKTSEVELQDGSTPILKSIARRLATAENERAESRFEYGQLLDKCEKITKRKYALEEVNKTKDKELTAKEKKINNKKQTIKALQAELACLQQEGGHGDGFSKNEFLMNLRSLKKLECVGEANGKLVDRLASQVQDQKREKKKLQEELERIKKLKKGVSTHKSSKETESEVSKYRLACQQLEKDLEQSRKENPNLPQVLDELKSTRAEVEKVNNEKEKLRKKVKEAQEGAVLCATIFGGCKDCDAKYMAQCNKKARIEGKKKKNVNKTKNGSASKRRRTIT